MILVFIFVFIVLVITVLLLSTVKVEINKLVLDNEKIHDINSLDFIKELNIYLQLCFFNRIKIVQIELDKNKLKKLPVNKIKEKMKKIDIKVPQVVYLLK